VRRVCLKTQPRLSPFVREDCLRTLDLGSKKSNVIWAIGIAEDERIFAEQNASEKLDSVFEEHQIDIFNLELPSVV